MRLTEPLASLLAESQAGALRVLARTDAGMTGRQVARLSGAAQHTTTKRALDKLERIGLVDVDRGLQHSVYRANRDHLLWPAIALSLEASSELERRIVGLVRDERADLLSVAVFGSVARGTAGDESDLDLVIVSDSTPAADFAVHLGDRVHAWTGNECAVLDFDRAQLHAAVDADDPIVESLRRDARTVYGTELRHLLA
ncbi:nucleotidyltransferase domain-containing protein [Curtobacterium sp. MCPF17_002]|jgi:predicted nucleotidyltransferase|uniref:nucleotidyltransferase domain-containing protein n=1 Tax=Curtobacterium sp. MCPF17_002 TaxID=2175645 RepID=UPI0011B3A4CD|nr:nucleotidyltransferase domain-containing protein [Curtobacterium sp. MCPF17_002]WIB78256.1 nucleotidyltransferase domain-containing protein [Curtobacterium sp. MCPF17_002]